MSITRDCSEEGGDSEGSDSDEGKSALLDSGGALVGGRDEEQEGGSEHGAGAKESEGQADSRRCQEVDGDTRTCLNGEEEVVEALIEGHFLGASADSRSIPKTDRARVVHVKDSM